MKHFFPLLLVLLFLVSCTKETNQEQPHSGTALKEFIVPTNHYLHVADVDSAIAHWQSGGVTKIVRLHVRNDSLFAPLTSFPAGDGLMTIRIYSRHKLHGYSLQYERTGNITLHHNHLIRFSAPGGMNDLSWNPRIILQHNNPSGFHVTAIVGIRPNDPYFEFRDVDPNWRHKAMVGRFYFEQGTAAEVAGGVWNCQNCLDASGNYTNNTFFSFLPTQIGNRSWNRIEFFIKLYQSESSVGELFIEYNF